MLDALWLGYLQTTMQARQSGYKRSLEQFSCDVATALLSLASSGDRRDFSNCGRWVGLG